MPPQRTACRHPLTPGAPGIYYLAVSRFNVDPGSVEGNIFPAAIEGGKDGPTGPGGGSPITGWSGGTVAGGTYEIVLPWAAFCQAEEQVEVSRLDSEVRDMRRFAKPQEAACCSWGSSCPCEGHPRLPELIDDVFMQCDVPGHPCLPSPVRYF